MRMVDLTFKSVGRTQAKEPRTGTNADDIRNFYSIITLEDASGKELRISAPLQAAEYITDVTSGKMPSRPTMHHLVHSMLQAMSMRLSQVEIKKAVRQSRYDAELYISKDRGDGKTEYAVLMGKPSDVIPLALLQGAKIIAKEDLLSE